jgi:predicted nucleic acid-binding protein
MKKFYLDTNIWLDYFENRSSGLIPLGEFAFQFLKSCLSNECEIYYSDFVIKELRKKLTIGEVEELFKIIKDKLLFVETNPVDLKEARIICKNSLHFADAIHLVLAKKADCVLITRDKHFDNTSFIEVSLPEKINWD